jgi:hypothetical protein
MSDIDTKPEKAFFLLLCGGLFSSIFWLQTPLWMDTLIAVFAFLSLGAGIEFTSPSPAHG